MEIVILANDTGRFASYSAHLLQNGFPCRVLTALPDEAPLAGTVYFVSFNLNSQPATAIAKKLEQAGMACIVFAEEAGVQTAAKLSSAKMSRTLQHPYTEKNFLMAVQTIVKNRKAQSEKDERKRQHDERLKARMKAAEGVKDHGIIIQEAPERLADKGAMVFKMDAPEPQTLVQAGGRSHDFFVIQEGAKAAGGNRREALASVPAEKASRPETEAVHENSVAPKKTFIVAVKEEAAPAAASPAVPAAPLSLSPRAPAREATMNQFWAVFGMCMIGSAVCLYCLYEIIFGM
jgi:hypothetical protein